ncbi:assimilatory sulfite reductase (NADPH) flavoprotein subunit [Celerinatantimonas sp. YJH-8]|uniref:assimilatory sulfite reductase (NADPH) flavoprotein subunit n=1 Tax=Celerinatantimonas sp. YJH-8 TaxID=3228714 RepID=UPI0038C174CD
MSLKELNVLSCPLSQPQLDALNQALAHLSPLQLAWVSGYLAGMNPPVATQNAASEVSFSASQTATILYASQTGNAKALAERLYEQAKQQGLAVELSNIGDFKLKSLKKETHLVIIASTNGEGEPPDDALEFHEFIGSSKAPKLNELSYSVLSLGDSSYELFCQCGIDFDERLGALGAKSAIARVDCDLDYEQSATEWMKQVLNWLSTELAAPAASLTDATPTVASEHHYDRLNPATAEVLTNQKITGRNSDKDIRHLEFDLEGIGLTYQPGDALGIWFENSPELVDEIINVMGWNAEQSVEVDGQSRRLRDALLQDYELTQTAPSFVSQWANWSDDAAIKALAEQKKLARDYAVTHQIVDVMKAYPASVEASDVLAVLRRLTPRMYSIASSQADVEAEVDLTVAVVSYPQGDAIRFGGCSGYLSRLEAGQQVRIFVESNQNFKLPADDSTPIIMVGPGTGIAPFRAFIQERDARDASGDNWLFFGNPHFTEDFLYQTEWQGYIKSGVLNRIDLAFSRDQANKIYVQDRLLEQASEVYQWLQRGAHIYVCGDATKMAKDVHQALVTIVSEQGQMEPKEAENWLKQLRKDKRYQRDVY